MTKTETLPTLDSHHALSPQLIQSFRENGHALVRGLAAPEELAAWRPLLADAVEARRAAAREGAYQKPLMERDTYHKAFLQVTNIWKEYEAVRRFVLAKRFARVAAELMGVEGVRIYHDQALYKEPGGGYTPWHQDQYYWPFDSMNTITMWMPMHDLGAEMGSLVFADGSHRNGAMGSVAISDESEEFYKQKVRELNLRLTINELRCGDATFHYGWTMHKAPGNVLDQMREVMTVIYFADGLKVAEPANEKQELDRVNWLASREPGSLADDEDMNPLVWKA